MTYANESVNSFRENGNQVCMKHEDYEFNFLTILIVWGLALSKKQFSSD